MSDSELLEDTECIANMKQVSYFQDKKSFVYKYIFPEQEFKLKKGRSVIIANNTDPNRADYAGKIQELDHINKSLLLRKGISKDQNKLPRILSIRVISQWVPALCGAFFLSTGLLSLFARWI